MKINSLEFLMDILYSLEKKRNDMIHSKKYYTEISGIFGMTAIIIMRIENSNEFLKIVLASLYAVICVFYATQAGRNAKVSTSETDKCLKQLHYALIISYISILIVLMI